MFNLKDLDTSHITELHLTDVEPGGIYIHKLNTLNASGKQMNPRLEKVLDMADESTDILGFCKDRMSKQSLDVRVTIVYEAINLTVDADMIRCKQDFAGILRLINEQEWIPKISMNTFVISLTNHCSIEESLLPTVSNLKVLAFGRDTYPCWRITNYDDQQMKAINAMAAYYIDEVYKMLKSIDERNNTTKP